MSEATEQPQILGIGECMVELHDDGSGRLRLSYGGDVLNTLTYVQRSGAQSAFATVTGDDHYGHWLRSGWQAEGIDCSLVRHDAGASPALYIIRNEPSGERNFHYWRNASPFKRLLDETDYAATLSQTMCDTEWVYVSGITLAMLDEESRAKLIAMLETAREHGAKIAFDPNYRARLWADVESAQHWLDRAYGCATLAMPSLEDEQALRQSEVDGDTLVRNISTFGAKEVVVKDGLNGSLVYVGDGVEHVPAAQVAQVADTTAAGDSFNGAYLAARISGNNATDAATAGARMAAHVVQHPGAIAPPRP